MFKQIDNKKTFPQMEDEVIDLWNRNKIFEKSVEQRSEDNLYVFYDGPPFISGLPHFGHLLGSIAKDIIPRYFTMKGKRVERVWGWDAHGLTVENKVQKKLGIKNRREIEDYGLEKFTKECYVYTSEISEEWKWYIDKIGRWVDMDNAYKTTDQNYMESVMWAFKELYDKDLIYEGVRTSLFCTTCGTPISNFEVAMDNSYKDMTDPAVTVKFKVTTEGKFKDMFILAWTTTPWTLPSNRALVLDEKEKYVVVSFGNESLILAKKRLEYVFGDQEYKIVEEINGKDLLGLEYEPLYKIVKPNEAEFKVYSYKGMVTMEEGTGIVHSAPGFGEIDTEMGRHYDLTVMTIIDDEGNFASADSVGLEKWEDNAYEGMFYKKANKFITADLVDRKLLFKDDKITHRFPYHDRCDTPLVYKAQSSWFIKVEVLKKRMLELNKDINWVPKHLQDGRFGKGIEQAPDWCISRNRYWAAPMPVWRAKDGDTIVVSSVKELEELSGQKVKDLHRPYIDEIKIEKDGKVFTRIPEVLDCWVESGSMPFAQIHYPFENQEKFENNYPGDYIVEYIAQTRAWFYVMHVLSTALFDSISFKNVVTTGVMSGNDGRKMSKTYGNYTDPKELLETIGGDALRLFLMGSPLMVGENANFDEGEIRNKVKNVLNPLWNTVKFFLIYADLHKWEPTEYKSSNNYLDKWIVTRLDQMLLDFSTSLESYEVPSAVRPVEEFVTDLSTWYVRRSRSRFADGDEEAFNTLYYVLVKFAKGAAPLIPFITESMYQELVTLDKKESVHLEDFPEVAKLTTKDENLFANMKLVRDLCNAGQALRVESGIKVKQPLNSLVLKGDVNLENWMNELISDELNVKEVRVATSSDKVKTMPSIKVFELIVYLDTQLDDELKAEGMVRELTRLIQASRKENGFQLGELVELQYSTDADELKNVLKKYEPLLKESTHLSSISETEIDSKEEKVGDYIIKLTTIKHS